MITRIKLLCQKSRRSKIPFEYEPGYVFITDPDCREYDWLAVYDELQCESERLACPREHTILMTEEPTSIKGYSRAYTRQFGHLLTNRPADAECHPHYHLGRGYYFWFTGRDYRESCQPVTATKDRVVSACVSAKRMRFTKHYSRYKLMETLSRSVPGLDWYGRGVKAFGRKFEVMDSYRYHIAIENHIAPYHWSEKVADAFLCECLPFYAGDPNLAEVFPAESFIPIPLDDPQEAVRIVNSAIAGGEYEKRREAILESKRLILERYNLWAQVIEVIKSSANEKTSQIQPTVVYGRKVLRRRNLSAAFEDGWWHLRKQIGLCR